MYSDMIRLFKQIAKDVIENDKPVAVQTGTVIQINPIHIRVDDKMTHKEEDGDLILTHLVKDYEVDITVQHSTDSIYKEWDTNHAHPGVGLATIPIDHEHEYRGRKKIIMHLALKKGEKVLLLRENGGQRYIVLDRVYDPIVEGEWI